MRVRLEDGVAVDHDDHLGVGGSDAGVQRRGLAAVGLADDPDAARSPSASTIVGGAVGGAVVDDDDLEVRVVARRQRADGALDADRLVVGGHDDRDRRRTVPRPWRRRRARVPGGRRAARRAATRSGDEDARRRRSASASAPVSQKARRTAHRNAIAAQRARRAAPPARPRPALRPSSSRSGNERGSPARCSRGIELRERGHGLRCGSPPPSWSITIPPRPAGGVALATIRATPGRAQSRES